MEHSHLLFGSRAGKTPQKEGRATPGRVGGQSGAIKSQLASLLTTTMVSFPPELFGAIVAEVRSPSDLLRLRATNSTLSAYATPLAFRSVCLANRDKSIQSFKLLVKSRLQPFVREVVFQYMEQDPSTFVGDRSIHLSRLNPCDWARMNNRQEKRTFTRLCATRI
jgi:hypothetical protein